MALLSDTLAALLRDALAAMGEVPEGPLVQPTQDPAHGDYQSTVAFRIARGLGQPPRLVAERIAAHLAHPMLAGVEVAGPGFVNLRLA
ncbi:MAG: arginine--tRNA ligase, partial [Deltaproteobacteria bacterium]|nr:arginine--tRNA ligase [Deltaproteobacteria bacterium]